MNTRAIGPLLAVMLLIAACGPTAEPANGDILISGAKQAGYTPIDLSLHEAADGLPPEGPRNPDAEQTDVICPDVWLIDEAGRR